MVITFWYSLQLYGMHYILIGICQSLDSKVNLCLENIIYI